MDFWCVRMLWGGSEGSHVCCCGWEVLPGEADGMVLEKGLLEAEGAARAWRELEECLHTGEAAAVCVPPTSELHQADQGSHPVATEIHGEFQVCLWAQDRTINKIAGRLL